MALRFMLRMVGIGVATAAQRSPRFPRALFS